MSLSFIKFRIVPALVTLMMPVVTLASGMQDVIVSLEQRTGEVSSNHEYARLFTQKLGIVPNHVYGSVFSGFAATLPASVIDQLERSPLVESISPNRRVSIIERDCILLILCTGSEEPEAQTVPWGVERIQAESDQAGAGVHVYVIDTGIDADHEDLAANIGEGYAVTPCIVGGLLSGNGACSADWDDDQGHGTHVAGTIGALDNQRDVVGVAPEVTLHAVKVLNALGSGTTADIIAGVDWVVDHAQALGQPVVANLSLGGSGEKQGSCSSTGHFEGTDNFHRALCNAKHSGVVFAVAAGNEGANAANTTPAAYDDVVVTVSATTAADDWATYSNWGEGSAAWTSHRSAPVAVAAPGTDILSTANGGGVQQLSGTSMASPHVAGVMALILGRYAQAPDGNAFHFVRDVLLDQSEPTDNFTNSTGVSHEESFLSASEL